MSLFNPPLSAVWDSRLSDDAIMVSPLSVDPAATLGIALAADSSGNLYPIAILADSGAAELQVSTTSSSGYVAVGLPQGARATEVVAFVDGSGTLHAFYATSVAVLHASRPIGTAQWGGPDTFSQGTRLVLTQVPLTNAWVVAAIGSDGNLLLITESSNGWSASPVDFGGVLTGGSIQIQYLSATAWVVFAAITKSNDLHVYSGTGTGAPQKPLLVSVANPVVRVDVAFYHDNSAMAVFADNQDNLYSTYGFTNTVVSIPYSNVATGCAYVSGGLLNYYGSDTSGNLFVLHQSGWSSGSSPTVPTWAPIFPLDVDVIQVTSCVIQVGLASSGAIAAVRADGSIDLLMQRSDNGLWLRSPLQSSSDSIPMRTTSYRTRLAIVDANGTPCSGQAVTLTPSSLLAIEVAGQSVVASPTQPATLAADETGVVNFSIPALGLSSVTFSASITGIATPIAIIPYAYLYPTLSGQDVSIYTGSSTVSPMSGPTLLAATVDGQPLAPNLGSSSTTAATVAGAIVQMMTLAGGSTSTTLQSFALDFSDPSSPSFVLFGTPDELRARAEAFRAQSISSIFKDIIHFPEDVWNAVMTGAMAIASVVFDATTGLISLTLQVAEDTLTTLEGLDLPGVGEIVSLVHGIFQALGAALGSVLDWLKDLLGWDVIWQTSQVFSSYLTQCLDVIGDFLQDQATTATNEFFTKLESDVDAGVAAATILLGTTSLGSPSAAYPGSGPLVQFPGSPAQNDWFLSKVMANLSNSSFLSGLAPSLPSDLITQIESAIADSDVIQDAVAAVAAVKTFFEGYTSDPHGLSAVLATDLLKVFQSLADTLLAAADALVTIVLDLIADAIQSAVTVLTTAMADVPVLTWLWENVIRPAGNEDPMTMLGLIGIVLAVPVTIAYTIANGQPPFPVPTSTDESSEASRIGAAEGSALDDFNFFYSLMLAGVDATCDLGNGLENIEEDAWRPNVVTFWNWTDFAANAISMVLYWPVSPILSTDWDWKSMSTGEIWTNATWIGYWAPILTDALFTGVQTLANIDGYKLPATVTTTNQVMDTVTGCILALTAGVGMGIQLGENSNLGVLDLLEAFVGPVPWASQLLLSSTMVTETSGASILVQCVIDVIADIDLEDLPT